MKSIFIFTFIRDNIALMIRFPSLISTLLPGIILSLILVSNASLQAQSTDIASSPTPELVTIFNHLYNDSIQHIRIEGDFTKLIDEKYSGKYEKAKVKLLKMDKVLETFKVKVRARGKTRRRICEFPPIKVKFNKKGIEERSLSTTGNDLKLVWPCSDGTVGEQDILKEYIVYKLYNEVTAASFRTQLVKIEFEDAGSDKASRQHLGFFIESEDEVKARLNAKSLSTYSLAGKDMKEEEYFNLILFQYMIGNTDWRIPFLHNLKILQTPTERPVAIPYDFDYSGLVNTAYAKPSPDFGLNNVRERFFMGNYKQNPDVWLATVERFRKLEPTFLTIIEQEPLLNRKEKKRMIRYIKSFYNIIDTDKSVLRNLKCNEW